MRIRDLEMTDMTNVISLWNEIIAEGNSFPEDTILSEEEGIEFFATQSAIGVAEDVSGALRGLYVLRSCGIGRCGHIGTASVAVSSTARGIHIGEKLLKDCMDKAREHGFKILELKDVREENMVANHLFTKLGFRLIGSIPNGFRNKDGSYSNTMIYYCEL